MLNALTPLSAHPGDCSAFHAFNKLIKLRFASAGADGQLLNKHRKVMPTMAERIWWGQGDGNSLHAVETAAGRIGALICWEHWMPLTRAALHASSEDVHVAAWPRVRGKLVQF